MLLAHSVSTLLVCRSASSLSSLFPVCQSVDFNKLEMSSLLRYKRFFKLTTSTSASKSEHISVIRRHFVNHPRLRDVEVISGFLYANNQHKLQNKQAIAQALQAQQEFKNAQAAAAAAAAAAAQTRAQIQADAEDERMWAEQNPQAAQQKQE